MGTKIEWATEVWNPVTGCTPVSEGCEHCYARRMAQRLKGRFGYPEDEPFQVIFHPNRLEQPFKWKKPRMIFVCSMGDLFHWSVSSEDIQSIFCAMGRAEYHTYLFLTKRPKRLLEECDYLFYNYGTGKMEIPSCFWFGVSVENQKRADERIPILLQIPAVKRFVSIEPMLGPVNLSYWLFEPKWNNFGDLKKNIDWIICGGESGPGARPMHPDWARSIRDQCQAAGVPFFFKQWGGINKKATGRLLDGREWNEYPII